MLNFFRVLGFDHHFTNADNLASTSWSFFSVSLLTIPYYINLLPSPIMELIDTPCVFLNAMSA